MHVGTLPGPRFRGRLPRALAVLVLAALGAVFLAAATAGADAPAPAGHVDVVQVSGWLDPVNVDYIERAVASAERGRAEALVVQLDSPGALVSRAALDRLIGRVSASKAPVAVWVGGSGARATGGAAELVLAADVAGMAPGARVGRAGAAADVPAALRTGTVTPAQAKRLGIVQLDQREAGVLGTFIAALDGKRVGDHVLETATFTAQKSGPPTAALTVQGRLAKLDLGPRLLHTFASPPVAYLLLTAGLGLLVFELFTAGVGIAGGVGGAFLVLAAYGLAILPIRNAALVLLLLGVFGFAIDVQTGAPRFWTGIGVVSFATGSLLLYRDPVSLGVIPLVGGVVGLVLLMLAGLPATVRSRFSTPTIGRESMIGETGEATADLRPEGVVQVRGALWPARTNRSTPVASGDAIRVVAIVGATLEVEPLK